MPKTKQEEFREENIMVGLSSSPSNKRIIREAARIAGAFRGRLTAVYVETSQSSRMTDENRKRLEQNMREAEQLGAAIETIYGEDVAVQLSEYAKLAGITKLVIGRSVIMNRFGVKRKTMTDRILVLVPQLDVYIIPDQTEKKLRQSLRKRLRLPKLRISDMMISLLILCLATGLGLVFDFFHLSVSNIIMVYIVGVLLTAVYTGGQVHSILSSVISVLLFNFFFIEPRFTMVAFEKEYPVTFLVMFAVAFISGSLAGRLKKHAGESARAAYRTQILFDTNHLLERSKNPSQIYEITARQIVRLLNRDIVIYRSEGDELGEAAAFDKEGNTISDGSFQVKTEKEAALWVLKNNKHAGASTDKYSDASCLYLAIRLNEVVYGVVGIRLEGRNLDNFEKNVLLSILGECSFALENERNRREKEEARSFAIKEELRANLLRSISHDLRTPLTSISGNASNLISNGQQLDEKTRQQLYTDIYDDSIWLIKIVENLLFVTRIEDGRMNITIVPEVIDEVISEALTHVSRLARDHVITVREPEDILLAEMDAKLIIQVIVNLVDNAIKYTESGSVIEISARRTDDGMIEVSVADNGGGVTDAAKEHIFDMFYTGGKKMADSRRSLGLGLFLCKAIIDAHGGNISISDNVPSGAAFSFRLKEYRAQLPEEPEVDL